MPKLTLTKKPYFESLSEDDQYKLMYETQMKVKRLERLAEGLTIWKESSIQYKGIISELKDYFE